MTKFKMSGFPNHHTGVQGKDLSNPVKFLGTIAGPTTAEFSKTNPFAGQKFASIFAPTTARRTGGGKKNKGGENPEYTMDPNQMDTNITSGSSSRATPTANNQTGAMVNVDTSSSGSSYSWP